MELRSHARKRAEQEAQQAAAAASLATQNAGQPAQNAAAPQRNATATRATRRAGPANRRALGRTGSLVVTDSNGQPLAHCNVHVGEDGVRTMDRQGSVTFTSANTLAGRVNGEPTSAQHFHTAQTHTSPEHEQMRERFTTPAPRPVPDQEDPLRAPHRPTTRPDLSNHRVFFLTDDDHEVAELALEQMRAPQRTQSELLRETHAEALRNQLRQVMMLNDEDLYALRQTDVLRALWDFQRERTEAKTRKGLGPEGTFLCDEQGNLTNPELENTAPPVSPVAPSSESLQGLQRTYTPCPQSHNSHPLRSPFHHRRPVNPEYHRQASTHRHPRFSGPPIPSTPRRPPRTPQVQRPTKQAHGAPAETAPPTPTPARNVAGQTPARLARLLQQESTYGDWDRRNAQPVLITDANGAGPSSVPMYFMPAQGGPSSSPTPLSGQSPGRRATAPLRRETALPFIPEAEASEERTPSVSAQTGGGNDGAEMNEAEECTPRAKGKGKRHAA
ncbi:hypothetical protein HDZ31DRAFT_32025 [Schizophyllum fasciatum]